MKITLNGKEKQLKPSQTLTDTIGQFCKDTHRVIAEVNGSIILSPEWANHILRDGDCVELVNFVGGG